MNITKEKILPLIKDIVIAVVVAFVILQFITPTIVKQTSMRPTFYENDYLLLSKQAYFFAEPAYGDIIVFESNEDAYKDEERLLIKRVIGVPGDTIEILDGKVFLNEEEIVEDYTFDHFTSGYVESSVVPEGHVFVMGDNRSNSKDSRDRDIGFVSSELIRGKVFIRLFPFDQIELF